MSNLPVARYPPNLSGPPTTPFVPDAGNLGVDFTENLSDIGSSIVYTEVPFELQPNSGGSLVVPMTGKWHFGFNKLRGDVLVENEVGDIVPSDEPDNILYGLKFADKTPSEWEVLPGPDNEKDYTRLIFPTSIYDVNVGFVEGELEIPKGLTPYAFAGYLGGDGALIRVVEADITFWYYPVAA